MAGVEVERRPGGRPSALIAQYLRIKGQHREAILLFRLGDFYEMFFEDAETAARVLDLTLTARNRGDPDEVPLCGFPAHAAQPYVARLLAAGHPVAICEQSEARGRGLLEREVVRVVTPGTILEEESLDPAAPSLLAALAADGDRYGLAAIDFATGAFRATEVAGWAAAREELERLGPRELLLAPGLPEDITAACRTGRPWATALLPEPAALAGRVGARTAGPRDLAQLAVALGRVAELRTTLGTARAEALVTLAGALDPLPDVAAEIARTLVDAPPPHTRLPGFIRAGRDAEVDELRESTRDGKGWLARFEAAERARTGIASLKVRYNRVFGYYVEVTRPNLALVPQDYERKQTLVGAERFVTPALKEHEARVLGAEERLRVLETHLFEALLDTVALRQPTLARTAEALAALDALAALAEVAHRRGYVRPRITEAPVLHIRGGRHPVVEAVAGARFVPNDATLDPDAEQVLVVTGPNMGGKSTYLRQVALITLLAQMGSFVPAAEAEIGLADRIFTRVGASDNLVGGESTFMVEMRETAHILANLTGRSLVVLDEIGRGRGASGGTLRPPSPSGSPPWRRWRSSLAWSTRHGRGREHAVAGARNGGAASGATGCSDHGREGIDGPLSARASACRTRGGKHASLGVGWGALPRHVVDRGRGCFRTGGCRGRRSRRRGRRPPWSGADPIAPPWDCPQPQLGRQRSLRYDFHRREGHVDRARGDLLQESGTDRFVLGRHRRIHLEHGGADRRGRGLRAWAAVLLRVVGDVPRPAERHPPEGEPRRHGVGRGFGQRDCVHADHHGRDAAVLHHPDVGGRGQELGRMDRRGAVALPRRFQCGVLLRRVRRRECIRGCPYRGDHGPGMGERPDHHGHPLGKGQGRAVLPPQRRHGLHGGLAAQVASAPLPDSGRRQSDRPGLVSLRALRSSFDVPDDPELFQHKQDDVHDVHLIPSVESVVSVARTGVEQMSETRGVLTLSAPAEWITFQTLDFLFPPKGQRRSTIAEVVNTAGRMVAQAGDYALSWAA